MFEALQLSADPDKKEPAPKSRKPKEPAPKPDEVAPAEEVKVEPDEVKVEAEPEVKASGWAALNASDVFLYDFVETINETLDEADCHWTLLRIRMKY